MRVEFARVAVRNVAGVFDFGSLNELHETLDKDRLWVDGNFTANMREMLFLIQPVVLLKCRKSLRVVAGVQSWLIYSRCCNPDDKIPVHLISGLTEDELNELIVADTVLRGCLSLKKGNQLGLIGHLWRKAKSQIAATSIWQLISRDKFSYRALARHLNTSTTAMSKGGEDGDR